MPKIFLYANEEISEEEQKAAIEREKVRILVIGPTSAINRVVTEMSHVGFSEAIEWSKPLPTDRKDESMRILTRYVLAE